MKTIQIAYTLGYMKRMNKGVRNPMKDTKFTKEYGGSITDSHIQSWLQGWDSADAEYSEVNKKIQKFSDFQESQIKESRKLYEADLQKEYGEIFTLLLKKYGVNSPADLSDNDKSDFFSKIKDYYTAGKGATSKGDSLLKKKSLNENVEIKVPVKYINSALAVFDDLFKKYGNIQDNIFYFDNEDSAYDFVHTLVNYTKIPKDVILSDNIAIKKLLKV